MSVGVLCSYYSKLIKCLYISLVLHVVILQCIRYFNYNKLRAYVHRH
jgi:hypothetical protein